MPRKDEYGLNPSQRRFCEEYLSNGFNANLAAQVAYPKNKDPFYFNAGYKMLENPNVSKYIHDSVNKMAADLHITAELIMKQLQGIALDQKAYPKDRLKALELIQKQMGLQNQKITLQALDNLNFNVSFDSDDDTQTDTDDS